MLSAFFGQISIYVCPIYAIMHLGDNMNNLPERIIRLRDELFDAETQTCFERQIITESYKRSEGEPQVVRRAKGLRDILLNMPVYIRDGEVLAAPEADFKGYEHMRQIFLNNKSRFGNDINETDDRSATSMILRRVSRTNNRN